MYTKPIYLIVIVILHLYLVTGNSNLNITHANNNISVTNNILNDNTKKSNAVESVVILDSDTNNKTTKIDFPSSNNNIYTEGNELPIKTSKSVPKKGVVPFVEEPVISGSIININTTTETITHTESISTANKTINVSNPKATATTTTIITSKNNDDAKSSSAINNNQQLNTATNTTKQTQNKNNTIISSTISAINKTISTTTTIPKIIKIKTTPQFIPKKPTILMIDNVHDDSLIQIPVSTKKLNAQVSGNNKEVPKIDASTEYIPKPKNQRDYIIPVVVVIFTICIVLGVATVVLRKIKDYWMTRHYRRMDFLVDEMYND